MAIKFTREDEQAIALLEAAYAADQAWHDELVRLFGRVGACDARYDERGGSTPVLAALRQAKLDADARMRRETK